MKQILILTSIFVSSLCANFAVAEDGHHAHHHHHGQPKIIEYGPAQQNEGIAIFPGYAKASVPGTKMSAGYLKIENHREKPIHLVKVTASAFTDHAELHHAYMEQEKMVMRKVERMTIQAGSALELKPGSYHLMFLQLKKRLLPEQTVTVTLHFEGGEAREVVLPVKRIIG